MRGVAPCVTTYQALFNGLSVFFRANIAAVIFDDSHAAEHLLRDQFSLKITRSAFEPTFTSIVGLFEDYFRNIGKASSIEEIKAEKGDRVLLVPPFELNAQISEVLRLLHEVGVQYLTETKFAWAHISDFVDLCALLVTANEVTITPPFVPVLNLPYFSKEVRRVYLSATLSAPDAFARTFGAVPDTIVAPKTTAGECERLIAIPSRIDENDPDGIVATRQVISDRKALILVPTYARAELWQGVAEPPPRDQVTAHVADFKADEGTPKLLLAARYDGVDLPGDTCRLMVIDDLPMGVGLLERFCWGSLGMNNSLRTAIASRIVQSFGRISRGMSDHGAVCLTGKRLIEWLLVRSNAAMLPAFLQKQILLGYELSKQFATQDDMDRAIDSCLKRDKGWLEAYNGFIQSAKADEEESDVERLRVLAESEANYAQRIWKRNYAGAAVSIAQTLDTAYSLSRSTGAWHSLWLGYAQECMGDIDSAWELYAKAHGNQPNIPGMRLLNSSADHSDVAPQIVEIESQINVSSEGMVSLPKTLEPDLKFLDGNGTPGQTEEALRCLGQYLGVLSTRPDKEYGTGPDVLWAIPSGLALCIDANTNKTDDSRYTKKELGQMSDHIQWVRNNTDADQILPLFVGPVNGATDTANPPAEFTVCSLDTFERLAKRLVSALKDATQNALPITLRPQLREVITQRQLMYPDLIASLGLVSIRNL